MSELVTAHNAIVNLTHTLEDEVTGIKMADLEDHNRRNNLCFRSVLEEIKQDSLEEFLQGVFKTLLPQMEHSLL